MVYGKRSMGDSNLHSSRDSKFVSVDFWPDTVTGSRFKNPGGLFDSEETFIAEDINEVRQSFLSYRSISTYSPCRPA